MSSTSVTPFARRVPSQRDQRLGGHLATIRSDAEHYDKAKKFQCSLLARDRFYQTDFFHERLEAQARKNLEDYFEYLRKLL